MKVKIAILTCLLPATLEMGTTMTCGAKDTVVEVEGPRKEDDRVFDVDNKGKLPCLKRKLMGSFPCLKRKRCRIYR